MLRHRDRISCETSWTDRPRPWRVRRTPPDDGGPRPGRDYRHIVEHDGRFLIYDAAWQRMLVLDRASGAFLEQWHTDGEELADVIDMVTDDPFDRGSTSRLVWVTPAGLYQVGLTSPSDGPPREPPPPRR